MKKFEQFLLSTLITLVSFNSIAQAPSNVTKIDATPNQITTIASNLKNGKVINDLKWASNSSVACFPGTQNKKFTGNHVLHYFEIPPYSEVTVTVIPKDKNANMSIYGYQVGTTNFSTPPNLNSCVSCEADHKWDYPKKGKTQDHTRSIFFNSIKNGYNIFIGVAGADGLSAGAYELKIDLKSKIENTNKQEALKIYNAPIEKGKTVAYAGNLKDGCMIQDLSFAANSSVACFPATQNIKFTGNHVFYVTEIPKYSKMYITLIPDDKNANMSLYAYQDGTTKTVYPPNVNSCVTCEADHKRDRPVKGKTQDHTRNVYLNAINNPYRVVIGVAGAEGLTNGKFKIQIKTE
jgi:hypothetical protein